MGAWGIHTFENDSALDWLGGFLDEPSEERILETFSAQPITIQPSLFGRLTGKKPVFLPAELEGEDVLAAAEVVATYFGRAAAKNPEELKTLPEIDVSDTARLRAIAAIDEMMASSNLKECLEETDDFPAWKADVEDLRARLTK